MTPDAEPTPGHALGPFVDIHSHYMPQVDDGAVSLAETVAMLRLAHDGGTRRLVATPHLFLAAFSGLRADVLRRRFAALQDDLAQMSGADGPPPALQLELAAEHHLAPELLAAIETGDVLPLGRGRRLLVELPVYLPPEGVVAGLEKILQAGYQPVLAHIERYSLLLTPRRHLRRLLDMGCLLQINADSLLSAHKPLRRTCADLLRRGWVQAVASDGHRADRRRPVLGPVADRLASRFGDQAARAWLCHGPAAVLDGDEIAIPRRRFRDWFESF